MIRRTGYLVTLVAITCLLALHLAAGAGAEEPPRKIVNGLGTVAAPSVVALITSESATTFCTGTLIGCETVLTAAHCFCGTETPGSTCQNQIDQGIIDPADSLVFAQHAGYFGVESIAVHPDYTFAASSDVAVLKLTTPVEGIAPTPINTAAKPMVGTTGGIAGFGSTRQNRPDKGVKRAGLVTTAPCTANGVPGATHICWNFTLPLGLPGVDSSICPGDSGGPLFVDFGGGPVVAGVTSGFLGGTNCLPPNQPWDADVFFDRAWIQSQGGADLSRTSCGALPQAGEPDAPIFGVEGNLSDASPQDSYNLIVPQSTSVVRFALNGEDGLDNDFDLYVRFGSSATTTVFDCSSQFLGTYEICEINQPQAGTWHFLVDRFNGAGGYQATVTVFSQDFAGGEDCTPSDTVLCLRGARFRIESGREAQAGFLPGVVVSADDGSAVLRYVSATKWELILNVQPRNGRYWFSASGLTEGREYEVSVEDVSTGETWEFILPESNPRVTNAPLSSIN